MAINVKINSSKILFLLFLFQILFFLFDYIINGNSVAGDVLQYFTMAKSFQNGMIPYNEFYLPGYPFVLSKICSVFNLPIYKSAIYFQLLLFLLNIYIVYLLVNNISKGKENLFFGLILMTSWWCFRIQKSAHADALFYTLFLFYLYLMITLLKSFNLKIYFYLSVILLVITQVKYNAYILLPFTFIWLIYLNRTSILSAFISSFSLLPSVIGILIWKNSNGTFNSRLNSSSFSSNVFSSSLINTVWINLKLIFLEISQLFISPFLADRLPDILNLIIGLSVLIGCIFIFIKSNSIILKFLISYFFVYLSGHTIINSFSGFTETNERTLISATVSLVMIVIVLINNSESLLNKRLQLSIVISFFLFTVMLVVKWLISTSPKNSFYQIQSIVNAYPNDFKIDERFKNRTLYTNKPNYFQLQYDYSLKTVELFVDREWKYGRWNKINERGIDSLSRLIDSALRKNNIAILNFPESENMKYLIKKLDSCGHSKKNIGTNSVQFIGMIQD